MIFRSGGGGTNNLQIYENAPQNGGGAILPGFSDTTGRTSASTSLVSGQTTLIQIVVGDSISANSAASAYTPVNTTNENFNIYNGLNYRYADPYLGPSTGPGSYPGIIADKLITAGKFARVISVGCSMGGCTSFDYSKSGAFSHRFRVALLYMRALGWPLSGSADTWRMAVIYALGTNDQAVGTSSANYTAYAQSCFQSFRDYGFNGKIFVAKTTMLANVVSASLQAAQAALVDNANGIYVGADVDSLTGATNRQADGTHLTTTGNTADAALWQTVFNAAY